MKELTDFLYPFIEGDESDAATLLADLSRSAAEKWAQSTALADETLAASAEMLAAAAQDMAERFGADGRLFVFGNGGSATDAQGVAQLYTAPPDVGLAGGSARPLPCRSLVADTAIITALGNDVGFDKVFSRQLIAQAGAGDIAMGFSTSGNSENILVAMSEADKRGMLTIGLAGIDGGRMATDNHIRHCLVVRSQSVHRVQESQASLTHALWRAIQAELAGTNPPGATSI